MTTLTSAERSNIMRIMREHGAPDPTIAAAFGVSRQSIHSLLGPRIDPPAPEIPPLDALMSLPHDTLCELAREALAQWRAHKGLSQRQAAAQLGVNPRTLQGWEMGKCSLPVMLLRYVNLLTQKDTDR